MKFTVTNLSPLEARAVFINIIELFISGTNICNSNEFRQIVALLDSLPNNHSATEVQRQLPYALVRACVALILRNDNPRYAKRNAFMVSSPVWPTSPIPAWKLPDRVWFTNLEVRQLHNLLKGSPSVKKAAAIRHKNAEVVQRQLHQDRIASAVKLLESEGYKVTQ